MSLSIFEETSNQCSIPTSLSKNNICSYIRLNCDTDYYKISQLYYCNSYSTTTLLLISFLILLSLTFILISLSILVSNYLFKYLNTLTNELNLNNQILSFILIPLTNSLPDFLNYYIALNSGSTNLVIGQLMGSLLIMFTIIIGLISILNSGYIVEHPKILMLDLSILLIVMVLFSEILSDGKITKIECWIMVAGYLGYILFLMFFDKDKLKEFDEEILIEYGEHHSHVFEHPYNIEDAVSILSHEENGSYGSIRSISRSASPLSSDHDRLSPTIEVPSENQALLFVPGKRPSQASIDDEDDDGDDNEEVFICVPEEKPSIWERLFDYVDLVFSIFVPCYKPIESSSKKNLIILWYTLETTFLYNYQFMEISYLYVLPVAILVFLIIKTIKFPKDLAISSVSFVGLISSLVIISNFAVLTLVLLKNLGLIWMISDYLLGLLVFSISNSLNDAITNLTISTKINPILGLNSCIGTPLLIILLGIGVNGLVITMKTGESIQFSLTRNVVISTVGLIFSIVFLIVYLPLNNFKIDKKGGGFLVMLYFVITTIEVYLE